jgi:hypothetical protein
LLSGALAFAQFRTVTVQNAGDNPVPTTIQNTPSVNVANTPTVSVSGTVNAAIAGTPSVNATITGTPAVSVTNLPMGTAGPAATTALATKSLDNPALEPFQKQLACTAAAATECQASFTVPPGKELVIEYVQFYSFENNPSSDQVANYDLTTLAGGQLGDFIFAPGVRIRPDTTIGEHQVRIYADSGTTVTFFGTSTSATSNVSYYAMLSGHLVNVP